MQIGLENPEAVSLALSPEVPNEVVEQVEALREKIVSGEIEVSRISRAKNSSSDTLGRGFGRAQPRGRPGRSRFRDIGTHIKGDDIPG